MNMEGFAMESTSPDVFPYGGNIASMLEVTNGPSSEAVVPEMDMDMDTDLSVMEDTYSEIDFEDFDGLGALFTQQEDLTKPDVTALNDLDEFDSLEQDTDMTVTSDKGAQVKKEDVTSDDDNDSDNNDSDSDTAVDKRLEKIFPMDALRKSRKEFTTWRKTCTNPRVRSLSIKESKRLASMRRVILARVYAERARSRKGKETKETQSQLAKAQAENAVLRRRLAAMEREYKMLLTSGRQKRVRVHVAGKL